MNQMEERVAALEKRVNALNQLVRSGVTEKEDIWLKLSKAAYVLNLSPDTLRRKIRESQADPEGCPYKKGIHWDGKTMYKVNVSKWHTAI
jgi:hypothetical protein